MKFDIADIGSFNENAFDIIGNKWMLISATEGNTIGTMTASWGGLGVLWNRNVAFAFIRPQRHTIEMVDASDCFTLSFFDEKYRSALGICGKLSGRNTDKIAEAGLTPHKLDDAAVTFEQARMVLVCKKIYKSRIDPAGFIDPTVNGFYPDKDYHYVFAGEITDYLLAKQD